MNLRNCLRELPFEKLSAALHVLLAEYMLCLPKECKIFEDQRKHQVGTYEKHRAYVFPFCRAVLRSRALKFIKNFDYTPCAAGR